MRPSRPRRRPVCSTTRKAANGLERSEAEERPGREGIVDAQWTMAPLGLSRTSFVSNAEYAFEIFIIESIWL